MTTSERTAYQGSLILTANHANGTDSWETGLNNNVLVLGCSGGGKTRHHLIPNLLQAQGSYIVLDSKGALFEQLADYLMYRGYVVDRLDFTGGRSTLGYDPLDHVRRGEDGAPNPQDVITIAQAICPQDSHRSDPFWSIASANYLSAYIAYVLEALPPEEQNMSSVIRVFEEGCEGHADQLFRQLEAKRGRTFAGSLYKRAKSTAGAEKMHASIMGIVAAHLLPFGSLAAQGCFENPRRVDFAEFSRTRRVLFVTLSDLDHSMAGATSLFVQQAFTCLCAYADRCPGGRLPVPVRFMLDDFANLNLPHIDDVMAVIRSREISCTIVCQTVSQLEARYGKAQANAIIGNCDTQLVLAFQDVETASYFALRANKPASTLLETPAGKWWLFVRGHRGVLDDAYDVEIHPSYGVLKELGDFVVPCWDEDDPFPWDEFPEVGLDDGMAA
ncbi:MAG: type IV secretory system conjugative DNA transfer family protein [Coriobacteriia bacterium]|nr:type IV secretory system conjugative DNA transfer family protein [Coriobacteriia bacterium]